MSNYPTVSRFHLSCACSTPSMMLSTLIGYTNYLR